MKSIGIGYGKAIIFGEHFVVYGLPGIASSINLITKCTFEKNDNGIISNDLVTGETVIYGQATYKNLDKVIGTILKETGIKERNFRLDLETNMSLKGGMGSSAALCVSIAKCLNKQFSLKLNKEDINKISFEAEKVFHKTPSGIDNTVSCYGGTIWFVKAKTQNIIERLKCKPVEIVMADTGKSHNTAEIVEMVRKQKEKEPEKYKKIFEEYERLVYKGRKALEEENWQTVGKLMNKNHELLKQINVSCEENDLIKEISIKAGALGAKLTGAGLGGNNIALTPGKALQEKVAKAIEKKGFKTYKLKIGVKPK